MSSTSDAEVFAPFAAGGFGNLHKRPVGIERDIKMLSGAAFQPDVGVYLFDDFLGDLLDASWAVDIDTGTTGVVSAAKGGIYKATTDGTDNDRVTLAHELNWASEMDLVLEARVKVDVITTVGMFVGFSDAKAEAAQTQPIAGSGSSDGITTTASNAVGFLFDTDMTTDQWHGAGVKANTDGTLASSFGAPVAATYQKLRLAVGSDETAYFWVDDEYKGSVASAVTKTVALTPIISVQNRSAAVHVLDVDYIWVVARDRTSAT
jgi:hypothetical protein